MKTLLRVLGSVVAFVVATGGGYEGFEVLQQHPADFVDKPVAIASNCTAPDVTISWKAGEQVAWTVQKTSGVTLDFQDSPFAIGKHFSVAPGPTATKSGGLTLGAKVCALATVFGVHCEYSYDINPGGSNCDPKVIVSK